MTLDDASPLVSERNTVTAPVPDITPVRVMFLPFHLLRRVAPPAPTVTLPASVWLPSSLRMVPPLIERLLAMVNAALFWIQSRKVPPVLIVAVPLPSALTVLVAAPPPVPIERMPPLIVTPPEKLLAVELERVSTPEPFFVRVPVPPRIPAPPRV